MSVRSPIGCGNRLVRKLYATLRAVCKSTGFALDASVTETSSMAVTKIVRISRFILGKDLSIGRILLLSFKQSMIGIIKKMICKNTDFFQNNRFFTSRCNKSGVYSLKK